MEPFADDITRSRSHAEVVANTDGDADVVAPDVDTPATGTLSDYLRHRLRDLEHRHAATLVRLAQRQAEATALRQRIASMRKEEDSELRQMQQALQGARRARISSEKATGALRDDLDEALADLRAARSRAQELEQRVATLSATLDATRADVERAAASRAWRYGHWLTRMARRMMLRKQQTDGALLSALGRIEDVQHPELTLPPTSARSESGVAPGA